MNRNFWGLFIMRLPCRRFIRYWLKKALKVLKKLNMKSFVILMIRQLRCATGNLDPVGIHTGDSIVVCPSQTLTNKEYQMLRDSALRLIRALRVEGGCNVQFALDPHSFRYYVIRSEPTCFPLLLHWPSKASGYPIARVSAKISVGMTLDEIPLVNTPASFEPALDYVVTKMPRFPFDKFADANQKLGTQMKATGEVMSIGRTFEESLLKAIRSLETGVFHLYMEKFDEKTREELLSYIKAGTDDRIFAVAQLLRLGCNVQTKFDILKSKIDGLFPGKNEENHRNGKYVKSKSMEQGRPA